ncbi:MAG: histidine kinase, partial [bacterium]|nr:histidine kinase [bacterium]
RFDRDNNRWKVYTAQDGLPDNMIYGILEDSGGCLWLSTNKGLSRFDPRQKSFKNFDVKDGLQADEFNTGADYKNPASGEMFFGGINGLNSFFPDQAKDNAYIPPVVITAFKKFNRPVVLDKAISETGEIRVPQADNFISFEFAALNYRNPAKNRYAYKLEGFDKDWIQSGTRRYASYTNLGGGTYTFRVKGSNDDGVWNNTGASVKVFIIPPFWKTTW